MLCPYFRSCFNLALKGNYDYLDGVVVPHACNNVDCIDTFWRYYVEVPYIHVLNIPHIVGASSYEFFRAELALYKESLEKHFGCNISTERLAQAIELHNGNRALVRQLYELRKQNPPLISGTEMLHVLIAVMTTPSNEVRPLLESVIEEVIHRREHPQSKPRLLIFGSVIDSTDFIELVESCGANVVVDDLCIGTRAYWHDVKMGEDPLHDLAVRYLDKVACPRTYREGREARFGHIMNFVREFSVNGVIIYVLNYCDTLEIDVPELQEYLREAGVPVLTIESDYTLSAIGRLRTRVQAFVEMIE